MLTIYISLTVLQTTSVNSQTSATPCERIIENSLTFYTLEKLLLVQEFWLSTSSLCVCVWITFVCFVLQDCPQENLFFGICSPVNIVLV